MDRRASCRIAGGDELIDERDAARSLTRSALALRRGMQQRVKHGSREFSVTQGTGPFWDTVTWKIASNDEFDAEIRIVRKARDDDKRR